MCYTEEDDELWKDDPYEFIRIKYGEYWYIKGLGLWSTPKDGSKNEGGGVDGT